MADDEAYDELVCLMQRDTPTISSEEAQRLIDANVQFGEHNQLYLSVGPYSPKQARTRSLKPIRSEAHVACLRTYCAHSSS
jgi:hypothetical protein